MSCKNWAKKKKALRCLDLATLSSEYSQTYPHGLWMKYDNAVKRQYRRGVLSKLRVSAGVSRVFAGAVAQGKLCPSRHEKSREKLTSCGKALWQLAFQIRPDFALQSVLAFGPQHGRYFPSSRSSRHMARTWVNYRPVIARHLRCLVSSRRWLTLIGTPQKHRES